MGFLFCILVFVCVSACIQSSEKLFLNAQEDNSDKFYDGNYKSGYAKVRDGAFMFWWLYYAGGDKTTANDKPLLLWIPDGPGIPSSGVGNFLEIGPQDMSFNDRKSSWVHNANVLFIDSPVGTGFSYVTDDSLLVTNQSDYEKDLLTLLEQFLAELPHFKKVPMHIFSKGYGAKPAAAMAHFLYSFNNSPDHDDAIEVNLKSVVFGSPFINPADVVEAYPEYVYQMGYVDEFEYKALNESSLKIVEAIQNKKFMDAERLGTEMIQKTPDVFPFYMSNVIQRTCFNTETELAGFMDHTIKPALSETIPSNVPKYQYMNETVYNALRDDIMTSANDQVNNILQQTTLRVYIYNGNLDAITPIAGALNWANNLRWNGAEAFKNATDVYMDGFSNIHYKTHDRLTFYWVSNAGHNVARDNPAAMTKILSDIIDHK